MNAKTVCLAAVAAVALLGCATQQVAPPPQRCENASCPVVVNVVNGQLQVSPSTLLIPSSNSGAVIVLLLQNRDYEFHAGSVRFKGANAAICDRNFVEHSHARRTYNLTDVWRDRVECKYEVTVYDSAGKALALDPVFSND